MKKGLCQDMFIWRREREKRREREERGEKREKRKEREERKKIYMSCIRMSFLLIIKENRCRKEEDASLTIEMYLLHLCFDSMYSL